MGTKKKPQYVHTMIYFIDLLERSYAVYYIRNHLASITKKKIEPTEQILLFPDSMIRNYLITARNYSSYQHVKCVRQYFCIFIITLHIFFFHYYLTKSNIMWIFVSKFFSICLRLLCFLSWVNLFHLSSIELFIMMKNKRNEIRFNFAIVFFRFFFFFFSVLK